MMHPEECPTCQTNGPELPGRDGHELHRAWHELYWAIASAIAGRILAYIFRTIQKIEDGK